MREAEQARVTLAELTDLLETADCRIDAWAESEESILELRPFDDVLVTVWGPGGEVLFEDICCAESFWATLDYIAVLFRGGLIP